MKTEHIILALRLVALLACCLYIAGFEISFNPIRIVFQRPLNFFAWFFLCVSILLFRYDAKKESYKTFMKLLDEVNDEIKKEKIS